MPTNSKEYMREYNALLKGSKTKQQYNQRYRDKQKIKIVKVLNDELNFLESCLYRVSNGTFFLANHDNNLEIKINNQINKIKESRL